MTPRDLTLRSDFSTCKKGVRFHPKIYGYGNLGSTGRLVELESPESHVLDWNRSTFFRLNEVGVASSVLFFRFSEVEDRIPYCIWRLRFMIKLFYIFTFHLSIFIFLTRRNAVEALYIGKSSDYLDLPLKMPRYCCPIEIFYFVF